MAILHTESSSGWGGQEIRILNEALAMRKKGYEEIFAVAKSGGLAKNAKKEGFVVYEVNFKRYALFYAFFKLLYIIIKHKVQIVNTHSSMDAWVGGFAARFTRTKIVRTRHLSTPIRKGLNSLLLYNFLADFVVTTSSSIIPMICSQAKLSPFAIRCIPTGVDPSKVTFSYEEVLAFRDKLGLKLDDILVGTTCFVRSWKGIDDFMQAALLLKEKKNIKWVIVGGGHVEKYREKAASLGLEETLIFTGHIEFPYNAIAAMDIFALLSTAHEGISQASLQAAYLKKPLITTTIGGLPEVCINCKTGLHVPPFSPEQVKEAVLQLCQNASIRDSFGANAKQLVLEKFTFDKTIADMESVYKSILL